MRFSVLCVFLFMLFAPSLKADQPVTVGLLSHDPKLYLGKDLDVRGILAAGALSAPYLYASLEDAKAKIESAAIDVISDDEAIRKALHVGEPACVILTGSFNIPGADGHVWTGMSGFGYLKVKSIRACPGSAGN